MKQYSFRNMLQPQLQMLFATALVLSTKVAVISAAEPAAKEVNSYTALLESAFVDGQTGWAVGRNSTILHTSDGGLSWELQHYDAGGSQERMLLGVDFYDKHLGLAVGQKGLILRTEDAGETWIPASRIRSPRWIQIKSWLTLNRPAIEGELHQLSEQCLGVGSSESSDQRGAEEIEKQSNLPDKSTPIDQTNPSDQTEEDKCQPGYRKQLAQQLQSVEEDFKREPEFVPARVVSSVNFYHVTFVNRVVALASSNEGLLRTTDAGRTWAIWQGERQRAGNVIYFVDEHRVWIAGDGGFVASSFDGQETWSLKSLKDPWKLTAIAFLDEKKGFVGGEAGLVMRTTDGGRTWQKIDTGSNERVIRLVMVNDQQIAAIHSHDVRLSHDGGESWAPIELPSTSPESHTDYSEEKPRAVSIEFIDEKNAFAVGWYGLVLKTTDGGRTWTHLRSEAKEKQDELTRLQGIDHSTFGFNMDMGYVHPAGRIRNRFGSGVQLGLEFLGGRGRFKFGGGFMVFLTDTNEDIVGIYEDGGAGKLKKRGALANISAYCQIRLWEKNRWLLRGLLGVGFIYHGFVVADEESDDLPKGAEYGRSRIGIGSSQALMFGKMFPRPRGKEIARWGVYLKAGISESWTWGTEKQTDLGTKEKKDFGTELWPFVGIGLSLY